MANPLASTSARNEVRTVAPKLIELSEKVLYGDVWERPGHLERALGNGVTRDEIGEMITHLAFYAGWPAAMTAGRIARKVFDGA
jgi:4-carboxymuconolactone decarboxylase